LPFWVSSFPPCTKIILRPVGSNISLQKFNIFPDISFCLFLLKHLQVLWAKLRISPNNTYTYVELCEFIEPTVWSCAASSCWRTSSFQWAILPKPLSLIRICFYNCCTL
jgi:hypothetical protein